MTDKDTKSTTKELSDTDLENVSGGIALNEELPQIMESSLDGKSNILKGFDGKGNDQVRFDGKGNDQVRKK